MAEAENPRAVAGDNSSHAVAAGELRQFLERIERLDEEMAGLRGDQKDIFAEAKGRGYDVKTMRRLLALRKLDHAERQERAALLQLYADALGMQNVFA